MYVPKGKGHFRRTYKLDPVAEYYLYQLVYKYKDIFKETNRSSRRSYGYIFEYGKPKPISYSYKEFKKDKSRLKN